MTAPSETALTEYTPELLTARFRNVVTRQFLAVAESYAALELTPAVAGDDKATALRHATGKTVLGHFALLHKLLGLDQTAAATPADLDLAGYRAMVASLEESGHD